MRSDRQEVTPALDYARALRVLRAARGMTQTEMAHQTGFTCSYISLLEHGRRRVPAEALERMAQVLRVSMPLVRVLAGERVLEGERSQVGMQLLKELQ